MYIRSFQTVVQLELHHKDLYDEVLANIIDESIDKVLVTRKNVIRKNFEVTKKLSFKSKKNL